MSDKIEVRKPGFFYSLIIATIILAVIIGFIIGFSAFGLPSWPFIFFVFYFTSIVTMAKEKLLQTSIGGFIGMTVGFSQDFLNLITKNESVALIGFLVLVIILIALIIDGRIKVIETFCMFMVTVLTGYAGGLPSNQYIGCVISYLIAVVLFIIIFAIISKRADSKQALVNGSDATESLH